MSASITPHDKAKELVKNLTTSNLNEADTRHRYIDQILHDVLGWPRSAVLCEHYIDPGYADYVLLGHDETPVLFIEAKKQGLSFTLPPAHSSSEHSSYVYVKTLLTDAQVKAVLIQVQEYCISTGCEYAAVTNGDQWIFFKTFQRNSDWRDLKAFVIRTVKYFDTQHLDALNTLSYTALSDKGSLAVRLGTAANIKRTRYFPKSRVPEYNLDVQQNYLANVLRPLADRYLGQMNPSDDEFMETCYVRIRDYQESIKGVSSIIRDSLTPYFKNYHVSEFFDDTRGGKLGARIESNLRERRPSSSLKKPKILMNRGLGESSD